MKPLRRAVLWVTGRDLLKSPLPVLPHPYAWKISGLPEPNWVLMFSSDNGLKIHLATGPNVLHRLMQRFMLGIRWRMTPAAQGKP